MARFVATATAMLLVALICGTVGSADEAEESCPGMRVFPGKGKLGSVSFSPRIHHEHGVTCLLCHHTGVEDGKCSNCHGVDPGVPNSQDAFHLLCKGCHKHEKLDNSCEFCHKPAPTDAPKPQ